MSNLISGGSGSQPLSWKLRMKIGLDAAKGLVYLHEKKVIHRDFKSSNILLDAVYKFVIINFDLCINNYKHMPLICYLDLIIMYCFEFNQTEL